MESIIRSENLSFSYFNTPVLKDINLSIEKSGSTFILGANGAGKSTLLKILCGILSPASGNVFYNGEDMKKIGRANLAREIAYVSQENIFGFPFTVKEVVLLGRSPYIGRFEFERQSDFELAKSAMELVGISHLEDRIINKISGGERQLVSLARAIAQQPQVMILDEPGTFLDLKHKSLIFKAIKNLVDQKRITIIVATHDISSVIYWVGNTILLKDGKIFCCGKSADVITEQNLKEVYQTDVKIFKDSNNLVISANPLN